MRGYFGDIESWRRRVGASLRAEGEEGPECGSLPKGSSKELARTVIAGPSGARLTLTVPIVGGAHQARHTSPDRWTVAGHGRWTDVHLGALNAAYGQTPFFPHFFPPLRKIISAAPGTPFTQLCSLIGDWVSDALRLPEAATAILRADPSQIAILAARACELQTALDPSLSVADAIFRLGPEAILPLSATFLNE